MSSGVLMKTTIFSILLMAATREVCAGQNVPPAVTSHVHCAVELPQYAQWYQQTPLSNGEPYVALDKRKHQIIGSYHRLKVQMSLDEVERLLGKPDFGRARPPIHLATTPEPTDTRCSYDLAYIVRKNGGNMVDTEDVAVYLSFSRDGKLLWAVPQNLPTLKELGSPAEGN
jgi:hypothetical protein